MATLQLLPAATQAPKPPISVDLSRFEKALTSDRYMMPTGLSLEEMREQILATAVKAKRK
ncbi:hypothetical protein [Pseudomonas peli]|uniref:hypothetical protein n=1 Tax=Pseudomonas peli TaxID=592361 RepID=UPI00285ACD16|nr:hypothetical protein [Pseudomonas peli]MDR7024242.1 hypothetical protein [Pseudomonas peli]